MVHNQAYRGSCEAWIEKRYASDAAHFKIWHRVINPLVFTAHYSQGGPARDTDRFKICFLDMGAAQGSSGYVLVVKRL